MKLRGIGAVGSGMEKICPECGNHPSEIDGLEGVVFLTMTMVLAGDLTIGVGWVYEG